MTRRDEGDSRVFLIVNTTRGITPRLFYERIKNSVLGKGYDLSLVICGNTISRRLNKSYRKKDYPANALSFPLDKKSGEIFINIHQVEREARKDKVSVKKRLLILYIHSLVHLAGFYHSVKMDKFEEKILSRRF